MFTRATRETFIEPACGELFVFFLFLSILSSAPAIRSINLPKKKKKIFTSFKNQELLSNIPLKSSNLTKMLVSSKLYVTNHIQKAKPQRRDLDQVKTDDLQFTYETHFFIFSRTRVSLLTTSQCWSLSFFFPEKELIKVGDKGCRVWTDLQLPKKESFSFSCFALFLTRVKQQLREGFRVNGHSGWGYPGGTLLSGAYFQIMIKINVFRI